jgi:hypothetical protein
MNTNYSSQISDYVIKNGTDYKYSSFDNENFNKFFLNDFLHYKIDGIVESGSVQKGFSQFLDLDGEYRHNFFGYRSPEFHKNTQAIFAGDSFTYGVGLPENGIWSSIINQKFNFDSVNMGFPGASVTGIVGNLMHYFKVYGNPEYLFCMFPDFSRMQVFLNKEIMVSSSNTKIDGITEIQMAHLSNYNNRPKYSKKPFLIEDVLPNEIPHYYSLKQIQMLEQYCDAAGIKFLWSMFEEPDHSSIVKLKNNEFGYYSHFIDTEQQRWSKDLNSNDVFSSIGEQEVAIKCHKTERETFGDRFFIAGDVELGRERAHFGIHRHIHAADFFIKEIERLNEDSWDKRNNT